MAEQNGMQPTSNEELLGNRIKLVTTKTGGHTWIIRMVSPFDFYNKELLPLGREIELNPQKVIEQKAREDVVAGGINKEPVSKAAKKQKQLMDYMGCCLENGVLKSDRRRRRRIVWWGEPNTDDEEISYTDLDIDEVTELYELIEEFSGLRRYLKIKKKINSNDEETTGQSAVDSGHDGPALRKDASTDSI